MHDWTGLLTKAIHHVARVGENAIDLGREALSARLGTAEGAHLSTFGSYADRAGTHILGRVLASVPGGGPLDRDSLLDNLANTWRRWDSNEVAGAEVYLHHDGEVIKVTSDDEGYYKATLPATKGQLWTTVRATLQTEKGEISAYHDVFNPNAQAASFGIISDLDDTVIHTGITSLLLAAKLTFLENAKTRKPLHGVSELYDALQKGSVGKPINPIFYVSNSPWNLYDLLWDFIQLNAIPKGPILLRDFGIDATKFINEKGSGHKLEKCLTLLDGFPDLPFVLVGDSGQEDAAIYAEVCSLRPGRVRAIYIRDVDPGIDSARDQEVHRAVAIAKAQGVPMILAPDSQAMSEHASELGLIAKAAVAEVIAEVHKDEQRPETGEQALKDATGEIL